MNTDLAIAMAAHTVRAMLDKAGAIIALCMVFGLACWSMFIGTLLGGYIAAGFAFFAYLWCRLIRGERHGEARRQRQLPTERLDDVPQAGAN